MSILFPNEMRKHPLYALCRAQIIDSLRRQDEALGPGLLRLRWSDEDLGTLVCTPRMALREGCGVEAALWFCEDPADENFQPVVFQLLPFGGRPQVIDVVAYEGQSDLETPILVFDGKNDLPTAMVQYLRAFIPRAKDAVEYRA
jgi:hypothetical protein